MSTEVPTIGTPAPENVAHPDMHTLTVPSITTQFSITIGV
jgi:hypothetical protein